MAWLAVGNLSVYAALAKQEPRAKEQFEKLISVPEHQEFIEHDTYREWREQIAESELTVNQLRKELLTTHEANFVDGMLDRVMQAQMYPRIRAAKEYGKLYIVVAPDGITDDFCYEFRAVSKPKALKRQREVMRELAHMDAYLLQRPKVFVDLYVRSTGDHEYIKEPLDSAGAENMLDHAGRPDVWMANWEAKRRGE